MAERENPAVRRSASETRKGKPAANASGKSLEQSKSEDHASLLTLVLL